MRCFYTRCAADERPRVLGLTATPLDSDRHAAREADDEAMHDSAKKGLSELAGRLDATLWTARPSESQDADAARLLEWPSFVSQPLESIAYVASVVADTQVQPGSRVLCNAAYVLWCLGQLLLALAVQLLVSLLDDGGTAPTPPLLAAINRQPLAVWLAANVMTGAVNIVMGDATAEVGAAVSLPVLVLYVAAVAAVAMAVEGEERLHLKQS